MLDHHESVESRLLSIEYLVPHVPVVQALE